jgi:hypothetical protein
MACKLILKITKNLKMAVDKMSVAEKLFGQESSRLKRHYQVVKVCLNFRAKSGKNCN